MRSTFKILFYLKKNTLRSNGKVPVMGRITVNGTVAQFSCKLNIFPELWDVKANKARGKSFEAQQINQTLDHIIARIVKSYNNLRDKNENISAHKVRNAFLGIDPEQKNLLEFFDEYLAEYKKRVGKDRAKSTYDNNANSRRLVGQFINQKLKLNDISIGEIDLTFMEKFAAYLLKDLGLSKGTVRNTTSKVRLFTHLALNKGWLKSDPLDGYHFKYEPPERKHLTDKQLRTVMETDLKNKHLDTVRDLFVFCCFTGLAYIDLKHLTKDKIFEQNGKCWIKANRQKSNTPYAVRLLPVPLAILEKYKDAPKILPGQLLPVPKYLSTFNNKIDRIMKLCGIEKHVRSHTARHTFATTVSLENHVPMTSLSLMLGHKHITTTEIYAKKTEKMVSEAADLLEDKLKGFYKNAL